MDQGGKLVVMTGGGRGIGEKAVRKLVRMCKCKGFQFDYPGILCQVGLGCKVIVGVRNPEAVQQVFEDCGDAVKVGLLCFFCVLYGHDNQNSAALLK